MNRSPFARTRLARPLVLLATLALLLLWAAQTTTADDQATTRVYLPVAADSTRFGAVPLGNGFSQVTDVTHAGDDRLFVAERHGVIKLSLIHI